MFTTMSVHARSASFRTQTLHSSRSQNASMNTKVREWRKRQSLRCFAGPMLDPFDSSSVDAFQRYIQSQVRAAEQLAGRVEEQTTKGGVTTYRREYSSSGSSFSRSYYREVIITRGAPVQTGAQPSLLPLPLPAMVFLAAAVAAWATATRKFVKNFECTLYQPNRKWLFAFAWPLLLLFSSNFRRQFASALRGQKVLLRDLQNDTKQQPQQ